MTANPLTATPPRPPGPAGNGWTAGRVIALVTGSVLLLVSLALLAGGGTLAWADEEQQHSGYVTTSTATYSTRGYALASDAISLHGRLGLAGPVRRRGPDPDLVRFVPPALRGHRHRPGRRALPGRRRLHEGGRPR